MVCAQKLSAHGRTDGGGSGRGIHFKVSITARIGTSAPGRRVLPHCAGEVEGLVIGLQVGGPLIASMLIDLTKVTDDIKSAKVASFKDRAMAIGELCVCMTAKFRDYFSSCLLL